MVPRGDIVAVQQDIPLGELVKVFEKASHSRLVAYDDTLDDPVGMVHIRDLIAFMTAQAAVDPQKTTKRKKPRPAGLDFNAIDLALPLSSTKIMREMLFVPPSMPALDLLEKMQATRIHLALVVDEYGGTDGLVSMEDIVEQIVGEIDDEHDDEVEPELMHEQPGGDWLVSALTPIEDFNEQTGADFPDEEYDTVGGMVTAEFGHLPEVGEEVGIGDYLFHVTEADDRRVQAFRVVKR